MKEYPSISAYTGKHLGEQCIAFDKFDGSNLRWEWSQKQGWYKFGTRRRLFDKSDIEYGCAIDIFNNKYAQPILDVVLKMNKKTENIIVYTEFFGPHSFAGQHDIQRLGVESNDPKDLVLFDVNISKKGFVSPFDFVEKFGHLHIPQIIYQGELTEEFVQNVRKDDFKLKEGVIIKGGESHKLWMEKVKTHNYLDRLKEKYKDNWKEFWE